MAKMRATLRKVMTQVTPPPSPKNNGEDVIKSETWSSRLRNNQTRSCNGVVRDFRRKGRSRLPLTSTPKVPSAIVVKKEPRDVFHNDDSNCSHSSDLSAPSPVCNGRMRTRQLSGESPTSASYWPRRSARLIGIPAETVDLEETSKKGNGSLSHEEGEDEDEEQHQDDPLVVAVNGDASVTGEIGQCGNCKEQQQRKRRNTGRGIEALLAEGEHFMHYPASPTSRGRSTYNSSSHRERVDSSASVELTQSPSPERPPQPPPAPLGPLPESVHQVQFSFEMVPSGTIWYQTFLRDEEQSQDDRPPPLDELQTAPFLLPYEMSLEAILKSNRTVRKKATTAKRKSKAERAAAAGPTFRPIISTRLQMQAAAAAAADTVTAGCSRQLQHTATSSSCSSSDETSARKRRRPGKPPNSRWMLPRKSPRCHASTMALICSKSDDDEAALIAAVVQDTQDPPVVRVPAAVQQQQQKPHRIPVQEDDNELVRLLKEMLTQGLDRRPENKEEEEEEPQPPPKKRGRPRKYPRPEDSDSAPTTKTKKMTAPSTQAPLVHLLDTPIDRIGDIVDERLLHQQHEYETMELSFSDDNNMPVWTTASAEEDVFHDVDSSSSVYETASEVGSTSTGTCDSQRVSSANSSGSRQRNGHHRHHHRRNHHGHRRKRPNMTGWPRSKKPRRPALLTLEDDLLPICIATDEDEEDDDDDFGPPPVLTPIREESSSLLLSSSAVSNAPPSSCGSSSNGYVMRSKPFQFQRKTLRFVGKRILRPAAQRSAPQRLQYWPCFPSSSSSTSGSKSSSGAGRTGGESVKSNSLRSGRKPRA